MRMENQQEIINAAVPHVLTWMAMRMMTTAFSLAFETGLLDLKEYMSPTDLAEIYKGHVMGSIDLERDLLKIVEDTDVKTVVASMEQLFDFVATYRIINNLDDMEFDLDDASIDLAILIYREEPFNATLSFMQQKNEECDNYFWYNMCIWRCIKMLSTGTPDIANDGDEFMKCYYDFLDEDVTSLNRNAALLYDLQRSLEIGMIGRIV
jgi:hypothetical protein